MSTGGFYTIGHSTRTIDEFIEILKEFKIKYLIDVRSVPRSHTNPQYNTDVLPEFLKPEKIKYKHFDKLGGFRGRRKSQPIASDTNAYWQNKSFRNYADYAMSEEFLEALDDLIEIGNKHSCAIMCAEVLWWRCHRRIITDYLIAAKKEVYHIISLKKAEKAKMNEAAYFNKKTGFISYPQK